MSSPTRLRDPRQLLFAGTGLLALLAAGITGYRVLEDMPWIDALYMTVITVSTVGFTEVHPLSPVGRIFTIGLIFAGVATATYSVTTIATFVFAGEWRTFRQLRRRQRMLGELRNHVIVCGYGRVGRHVVDELRSEGLPFAVIDPLAQKVTRLEQDGILALQGDAAQEANLRAAGIDHARGLVACANSDAENVFIVLTARSLRTGLNIIARADAEESEAKLRRAGANKVILPYLLTGRRMVCLLTRPDVADFLDEVTHTSGLELLVEQIPVPATSPLAGRALAAVRAALGPDLTVLAVKGPDGRLGTRLPEDAIVAGGSLLIVVGAQHNVRKALDT